MKRTVTIRETVRPQARGKGVGKALMGHRVGDEVEVSTPNASYRVRIVGVD